MTVLCVRRGGLGDTLLMVPVLRALRRAEPAQPLHFAGVAEFAAVLARCGVVDRALSSEDLAAAVLRQGERPAWANDYRLVVADDVRYGALAAGGAVRCFDPRPHDERPLPQQVSSQLGLSLRWPHDAWLAAPSARRDGPVLLAPGSGAAAKCWPRAGWLALAAALGAREPVAVLVGPVELERDDPRGWSWPTEVGFVVEPHVTAVAELLRGARAFVGNDSGTTHLAAMLGVPTVALFGPSVASVFAPNGPSVQVVEAPRRVLADLPAALVLAALGAVRAAAGHGRRARTRSQ